MSDSVLENIKNVFNNSNLAGYQRLLCHTDPEIEKERKRSIRQDVAKSKSNHHVWGPTHSQDSDDKEDSSVGPQTPVAASPNDKFATNPPADYSSAGGIFGGIMKSASETINNYMQGTICTPCNQCQGEINGEEVDEENHRNRGGRSTKSRQSVHKKTSDTSSNMPGDADDGKGQSKSKGEIDDSDARAAANAMAVENENLWEPPPPPTTPSPSKKGGKKNVLNSEKRLRKRDPPPFKSISFKNDQKFVKTISELTLQTSHGMSPTKLSSSRRMAYYAVGNHKKDGVDNGGAGGNKRCYFTGEIIRDGQPFYAGSVQQGLRTLVVFCLPKALGLPSREELDRVSAIEDTRSMKSTKSNISQKSRQSLFSKYSSVWSDGAAIQSQHTDWEEDENGNLNETMNAELLLQALPEPNQEIMDQMEMRYPEQFATLSDQYRQHKCWRCYTTFCFFSGLPIADGEMYYKVIDKISTKLRKHLRRLGIHQIILSHEVMESVHGDSAEIVNLPTKKTFQYLQENYPQQCAKLNDRVFKRTNWEKIMPEV